MKEIMNFFRENYKKAIVVPMLCVGLLCSMSTAFAATSASKTKNWSCIYGSGTITDTATRNTTTGGWSFSASRTAYMDDNFTAGGALSGNYQLYNDGRKVIHSVSVPVYNQLGTIVTSGGATFEFNWNGSSVY